MSSVVARGLVKRYGSTPVLDGIDFDIGHGITGLLGANGSGKTTLLGLMLGLHRLDAGTLRVFDIDPATAGADVRARLGYAPEHHTLPGDVRAADFVRHVAELHGLPKAEATTRSSDALWLVGLGEERFRPLGTLSTGQRQRVKLAQAIAHDPVLVLLDEPTDGLDPVQRDDMLELISSVAQRHGIDFVISSHLLDEVEQICDGAVIIGDGRVLAAGSLDELRGTGSDLVAELDDEADAAAIADRLRSAGLDVDLDVRMLVVRGADRTANDVVRDMCADRGAGIVRFNMNRLSLEDVYLARAGVGAAGIGVSVGGVEARIHERGYRRFAGARTGTRGAMRALVVHSIQRALGLHRSARHKLMPIAVAVMAYLPGAAFVGVAALVPGDLEEQFLPTYAEYYGFVIAALFLFAGFVAPELLCTDRRTGMLGVYLASPLDRRTYLAAKAIAVYILLGIVTLGPPLLLLVALSLEGSGPESWLEGLKLAARIVLSGLVMSSVFAAVSLAASAATDRKAAATATILGVLVGTTALTGVLVEEAGLSPLIYLAGLLYLPIELTFRIHGEAGNPELASVSTWAMWLALAALVGGSTAWVWDRYRRLVVRR